MKKQLLTHKYERFKFSIWYRSFFRYKKQDTVKSSFNLSKLPLTSAISKPSISNLELQAAVMVTRLKASLLKGIKENIMKLFLMDLYSTQSQQNTQHFTCYLLVIGITYQPSRISQISL